METYRKYTVKDITDFNLDHVFDCGQCFRWDRQQDGSYTGAAMGKVVNISMPDENTMVIDNCTEEDFRTVWRTYLDLDRNYGGIKKTLGDSDGVMTEAIDHGYGIRLLQQDLWESIVSFIISQNNNIPRIKGCIDRLAQLCGEPIGTFWDREYFSLPSPEALAGQTVESLGPVRLGYRAKYLIKTAEAVASEGLPQDYEQLCRLQGVGPKVANCIALFGMKEYSSFPIDVWMRRVMNVMYGIPEADGAEMTKYAEEHFGELSGFAQQYLFYYMRERGRDKE